MSKRQSAGLLMFRETTVGLEVFIAHPGGPKYAERDEGVWSIPKGEFEAGEPPFETAQREFQEETGLQAPETRYLDLGTIQQKGGKTVQAWAFNGENLNIDSIQSNEIDIEWPKGSGERIRIPEVDQAAYFSLPNARKKLKARQVPFLDRLEQLLKPTRPANPQENK